MNNDEKEAKRMKELLTEAENHPLMKKILKEKASATLVKRKEAAGKIESLTQEFNESLSKLQTDLKEKEENYKKVKASLDVASNEFHKAKYELSAKNHYFEGAINTQKQILRDNAPPEIDEGIAFFNEKLDWLRSPGRISRVARGSIRNIFMMKKILKEESNVSAVKAALQYCQNAIQELERMKLEPTLDLKKIEKLKAEIPDINVFTEHKGEKPLAKVPNPSAWIKSNDQIKWEKEQLDEKFEKVIKK